MNNVKKNKNKIDEDIDEDNQQKLFIQANEHFKHLLKPTKLSLQQLEFLRLLDFSLNRIRGSGVDSDNDNDNDNNDLHDISSDHSNYSNINLNNSSHNHHFNRYHRHREFKRVTAPPTSYEDFNYVLPHDLPLPSTLPHLLCSIEDATSNDESSTAIDVPTKRELDDYLNENNCPPKSKRRLNSNEALPSTSSSNSNHRIKPPLLTQAEKMYLDSFLDDNVDHQNDFKPILPHGFTSWKSAREDIERLEYLARQAHTEAVAGLAMARSQFYSRNNNNKHQQSHQLKHEEDVVDPSLEALAHSNLQPNDFDQHSSQSHNQQSLLSIQAIQALTDTLNKEGLAQLVQTLTNVQDNNNNNNNNESNNQDAQSILQHLSKFSTGDQSTSSTSNDASAAAATIEETLASLPHNQHNRKKDLLTHDQKRTNHIQSEQKRRNAIKSGYNDLAAILASASGHSIPDPTASTSSRGRGASGSKSVVLFKAVGLIQWIERLNEALEKEVNKWEQSAAMALLHAAAAVKDQNNEHDDQINNNNSNNDQNQNNQNNDDVNNYNIAISNCRNENDSNNDDEDDVSNQNNNDQANLTALFQHYSQNYS